MRRSSQIPSYQKVGLTTPEAIYDDLSYWLAEENQQQLHNITKILCQQLITPVIGKFSWLLIQHLNC